MSFAKNILEKYGWKEGEGLGKNSSGITKPIKASLKFNQAGLGVDPAKDLTDNWWERVFDEAANNLEVSKKNEKVTVRQKEKDAVEISNKSYSLKKLKEKSGGSMTYGSFLKSSTLLANVGKEEDIADHVKTEDIEFNKPRVLTDEELFAACGGRTAHKGARHGLNLTGKLSRIEEQNNILIAKLKESSFADVIKSNEWQTVKSKKSKKKKKYQAMEDDEPHPEEEEDELKGMLNNTQYILKKSNKNKADGAKVAEDLLEDISSTLNMFDTLQDGDEGSSSRMAQDNDDDEDQHQHERTLSRNSMKIKKKKNKSNKNSKKIKEMEEVQNFAIVADKYKKNIPIKIPEISQPLKKKKKILVSEESSSDEDIVEKINAEQTKIKCKIRASNPKINITKIVDEGSLETGEKFIESHKSRARKLKRLGNKKHKRGVKKTKPKDRYMAQLADQLNETVALVE